ncbi:Uncharacterised protein [Mycobacteroides abscessus subsp. abscessus]|nr:Uncharacterised protein [Mycobacteroides abscessus subsp. abscessus]SHW33352.1 Uncharacterised protein [Mycobacteroides abscessus subsp. abscessus]SID43637.1 Uncharacterised protein [Mycobacteroides abscessus subsp. abscessus]SKL13013.1 Uncharacterised protein [Mycobacteroides abscessus subsp. abscessus]
MTEPHDRAHAVAFHSDQIRYLRGVHRLIAGDLAQGIDIQGFAHRQDLESAEHGVVDMFESIPDQGIQSGGHHRVPAQLPHPVHLGE